MSAYPASAQRPTSAIPPADYQRAVAAGRAWGEHALAVIREAAAKTRAGEAPVSRHCLTCARTWPFGTLAYESIASTGTCPTCRNTTGPDLRPAA